MTQARQHIMPNDHQMSTARQHRRLWEITIVFVAGGIGGIARYGLGSLLPPMTGRPIPTSLLINSIGCFLVGVGVEFATDSHRGSVPVDRRRGMPLSILFATGFCGGFTTIAAVTPESIGIFQSGDQGRAALYALGSLLLANVSLTIGGRVGRRIARRRSE